MKKFSFFLGVLVFSAGIAMAQDSRIKEMKGEGAKQGEMGMMNMDECKIMCSMMKSKSGGHDAGENALEILKKRYAKGEINRQEFEAMRKAVQ